MKKFDLILDLQRIAEVCEVDVQVEHDGAVTYVDVVGPHGKTGVDPVLKFLRTTEYVTTPDREDWNGRSMYRFDYPGNLIVYVTAFHE